MREWVWVGDDERHILISVFPGEAGGADLYVTPETAEDIARRLEAAARHVRRAFLFGGDGGINTHTTEDVVDG
jgi:hypothetical protein